MTTPKKTLSTHEKENRNPIKWIVLLIILIPIFLFYVVPETKSWNKKRNFYSTNTPIVKELKEEEKIKDTLLKEKEIELEVFQKEKRLEELQTFPKEIDIPKIVQILEVYTLQLKNLITANYTPYFELKNIDFGRTQETEGGEYKETEATIEFETDEENFKEIMLFLQSGNLSKRFEEGFTNIPPQIDANSYHFLKTHKLPTLHITSIQYTSLEEKQKAAQRRRRTEDTTTTQNQTGLLTATLKVIFFSHPTITE